MGFSFRNQQPLFAGMPLVLLLLVFLGLRSDLSAAQVVPAKTAPSTAESGAGPLLMAHYMPWYSAKPFSDDWGWHWTMNHFDPEIVANGQREIAARFYPTIGPYDSGDPDVLEYHLLLMKLAGIDGVIVDWYGLTDLNDYGILHRNTTRLLEHCEKFGMKFVICYEDQTIPALVKAKRLTPEQRVSHAIDELNWLAKYWFKSPSYVSLAGKPVLLSFGHAGLSNEEWLECLTGLDQQVAYFSQDFRRKGASGGFGWPVPQQGIEHTKQFARESQGWPFAIPVAYPRFVDIYRQAKVSDGYPVIPDNSGQTFEFTLRNAINSQPVIAQIATWNDWGEGTQIEPSIEYGYRDLEHILNVRRQALNVRRQAAESAGLELTTTPADLRLPARLLKLRRSNKVETDKLSALSKMILEGKLQEAAEQLAELEVEVR